MGNFLYTIGNNKRNYFSFSERSIPYSTLENVLKTIGNNNLKNFQNKLTFTIDNNEELELILREIKNNILQKFDEINVSLSDDKDLIQKLLKFKREIAHLRDDKHVNIRVLIKFYSSLTEIKKEIGKITFVQSMSNEKRAELKD